MARDLDLNQTTSWYMQQRIRAAMASDEAYLLHGIVEVDETYIGGKLVTVHLSEVVVRRKLRSLVQSLVEVRL